MQDTKPKWNIRPAQPEDAVEIVALLNQVFGDWGDIEDWRWKYPQCATPFRLPSAVAELDGQIIAHYGIVPVEVVMEGTIVRGAQTVDAGVLPTHRGQGIHSALGRFVLNHAGDTAGVPVIYAFPGLRSLQVDKRFGQIPVAYVPEMARLLQPSHALSRFLRLLPGDICSGWAAMRSQHLPASAEGRLARLRRSLTLLASLISTPAWPIRRLSPRKTGLAISVISDVDWRFDDLWEQVRSHTRLGLVKNARYLKWRYLDNPSQSYEIIGATSGQALIAFLVMRCAGTESQVVDLVSLPGRTDAVELLLYEAMARSRRTGSLLLTTWVAPSHPFQSCFRRAGFVSQGCLQWLADRCPSLKYWLYQMSVYIRHLPSDDQARVLALASVWPLAMGDSDLV